MNKTTKRTCEPAQTFPRKWFKGFVIQMVLTKPSLLPMLISWFLVLAPRLPTKELLVSSPSSKM